MNGLSIKLKMYFHTNKNSKSLSEINCVLKKKKSEVGKIFVSRVLSREGLLSIRKKMKSHEWSQLRLFGKFDFGFNLTYFVYLPWNCISYTTSFDFKFVNSIKYSHANNIVVRYFLFLNVIMDSRYLLLYGSVNHGSLLNAVRQV